MPLCALGTCSVDLGSLIGPFAHLGLLFNSTFRFFFSALSSSIPTLHSHSRASHRSLSSSTTKLPSAFPLFICIRPLCCSCVVLCTCGCFSLLHIKPYAHRPIPHFIIFRLKAASIISNRPIVPSHFIYLHRALASPFLCCAVFISRAVDSSLP